MNPYLLIFLTVLAAAIASYITSTAAAARFLNRHESAFIGVPGPQGPQGPQGLQGETGATISCACPAVEAQKPNIEVTTITI
jgi:hypothetical protein